MLEKSRFADEMCKRYGELNIGMVKFYKDGVVQVVIGICEVTFAYLILLMSFLFVHIFNIAVRNLAKYFTVYQRRYITVLRRTRCEKLL